MIPIIIIGSVVLVGIVFLVRFLITKNSKKHTLPSVSSKNKKDENKKPAFKIEMKQVHWFALLLGLASGGILFFLSDHLFFPTLENAFYDARFTIRDMRNADYLNYHLNRYTIHPAILEANGMQFPVTNFMAVVVKIDDKSLEALGRFPWPRDVYARLLNEVSMVDENLIAPPKGVFFDLLFEEWVKAPQGVLNSMENDAELYEKTKNIYANMDRAFAEAMEYFGSVYIDLNLLKNKRDVPAHRKNARKLMIQKMKQYLIPVEGDIKGYDFEFEDFNILLPPYVKSCKAFGAINVEGERHDKVLRSMNMVYPVLVDGTPYFIPSNVFLLILNYFGVDINNLKNNISIVLGDAIRFKNIYYDKDLMEYKGDDKDIKQMRDEFKSFAGDTYLSQPEVVIPIDYHGKVRVNYAGSDYLIAKTEDGKSQIIHSVPSVSFVDILNRDPDTLQMIAGRYLFIGAYSSGVADDIHNTPFGKMFGITHLANSFNTIFTSQYVTESPWVLDLTLLLVVGLILAGVMAFTDIRISAGVLLVILVIIPIVSYFLFANSNYDLQTTPVMITAVVVFIGVTVLKMLTEQKDKQMIKNSFSKYVSKSVVDELLKNPSAITLGGEKKDITVFFSDVRGFTTISEKLGDPQKLVELLNEYLGAMTNLIIETQGTLDKYVGDEIMAFWGAPVPQEDHALLACRSACHQMKFLWRVLQPKHILEGKPKVEIGCGLNTGEMTVGNMGSSSRMDYTLMGDNVNLGARLEGTNKVYGTGIIISEYTYARVKDDVYVRPLDLIAVKGKSKPVAIYELICIKGEEEETYYYRPDELVRWAEEAYAAVDAGVKPPAPPSSVYEYMIAEMKAHNLTSEVITFE